MVRNRQDGKRHDRRMVRFALTGVLATVLVAGCAGSGHLAKAGDYSTKAERKATGERDKTVAAAELAVQASPQDAALRAALGGAYLDAGRFASAAASYQDAIALGDDGDSTALRLALAQIGTGQGREAVVILDAHRDGIPASDLGLAMALAGETGRGVEILSDALRGGENSAKLRQNLAYAFALDGRWAEARLMAAQDVPADQIDDRIGSWAMTSNRGQYDQRVAALLDAPVRADRGQPAELALGDRAAAPVALAAAAPATAGELPPSDPSQDFAFATPVAAPEPVAAPVAPAAFATAFAEAPRPFAAPRATPVRAVKATARPAIAYKPVSGGKHRVQLGSFSSPENARRAVKALKSRYPELKSFELTITPAVVHSRNFWRVAAAGFNSMSAYSMCSTVRTRGGGCIAYSTSRPLPGGSPARGNGGAALARR